MKHSSTYNLQKIFKRFLSRKLYLSVMDAVFFKGKNENDCVKMRNTLNTNGVS